MAKRSRNLSKISKFSKFSNQLEERREFSRKKQGGEDGKIDSWLAAIFLHARHNILINLHFDFICKSYTIVGQSNRERILFSLVREIRPA